ERGHAPQVTTTVRVDRHTRDLREEEVHAREEVDPYLAVLVRVQNVLLVQERPIGTGREPARDDRPTPGRRRPRRYADLERALLDELTGRAARERDGEVPVVVETAGEEAVEVVAVTADDRLRRGALGQVQRAGDSGGLRHDERRRERRAEEGEGTPRGRRQPCGGEPPGPVVRPPGAPALPPRHAAPVCP